MDDEVYEVAAGLKKSIPPYKMYLLTRGVPEETNNILHVAAQHGNADFVSSTLKDLDQSSYFTLLCQPNSKGETPLHLAAESGDMSTVEVLLRAHDHGSMDAKDKKKLCWRERDKKGDTPLHRALRFGYDDVALMLLDTDGDLVSIENNARESAAYLACVRLCLKFLRKILVPEFHFYSSVSFSGPRGMTVFHPARKLTEDIMSDLIKARKELLKVQDEKGKTVLHYAVEENIVLMVKKLLTADSSLACLHDKDGMTPLHIAASEGLPTVIKTTLELSPQSILEVTADGKTALHVAVAKRSAYFVRVCLWNTRMKELINVADNQGNTPLHLALAQDVTDARHQLDVAVAKRIACFIRECLSNTRTKEVINVADNQGNTPLDLALAPDVTDAPHQRDVADALLEVAGINWSLENDKGLTPVDLCDSDDKIPLKLKRLTREWRRPKEIINVELFSSKNKDYWFNEPWDELEKFRGPHGDSVFHKVARYGYMKMIKRIKRDSDPRVRNQLLHGKNSRGETPLHMAAAAGNLDAVEAIVNIFLSVSPGDATADEASTRRRHVLLDADQLELDIFDVDNEGDQAAAARCRPWMVKSENGDTPAHKAIRNGHDDVALYILNLDLPSLACCVTDANESLLYLAAQHDCYKVVQRIVSKSSLADPSSLVFSGPHGQNPLHAATTSAGGVVKDIEGASYINMLNNYVEALSSTTSLINKFSDWVGTPLIKANPKLLNKADNYGKTPLHYAAELGQPMAVKKLLEGDQSAANMYDNQGYTPLLRAVATGHGLCAHYILKYCVSSIDLRHATNQKTALHLAKLPTRLPLSGCLHYTLKKCMRKHEEMRRLINETDAEGNTPLHCAVLESDQDKALLLLSTRGVNPSIRNDQDKTPADLCRELLTDDPKQRAMWIAFKCVKVGEEVIPCWRSTLVSVIKFILSHNDLLLRGNDEDLKKLLNNVSVAATLLVTLTFAATFAIPGGYIQDNGKPDNGRAVRMGERALKCFVTSNVLATMFGIGVLLKYTLGLIRRSESLGRMTIECMILLYCAVLATIVAFISGVYVIVAHDAMWIAILGTALSVIVFVSSF